MAAMVTARLRQLKMPRLDAYDTDADLQANFTGSWIHQ
jgi:hypothetical protein